MLLVPRYCRRDYICYKEVKVSKGLKYTFLVHAILGTIMALGFLFIPNNIADWYGTTSFDPGLARLLGASVLAVSVSSWLSFGAKDVLQVRITAAMEIWLTVVSALVSLYDILFGNSPAMMWLNVAVFAIFAILFIAFYPRASK
jgi:hypothetical protein